MTALNDKARSASNPTGETSGSVQLVVTAAVEMSPSIREKDIIVLTYLSERTEHLKQEIQTFLGRVSG